MAPLAYWGAGLSGANIHHAIDQRFRISRQGGFAGVDLVLFLIAYFFSNSNGGLRAFYADGKEVWTALAHLFHRRTLPTPASVSRMLHAVRLPEVQQFGEWLLIHGLAVETFLQHPAGQHHDARGEPWHVFDYDPTHTALRQRALPEREGQPPGRRLALNMAKPGSPGRKRGELHFNRSLMCHAGSGLVVHIGIGEGSGDLYGQLDQALEAARLFSDHHKIPRERTVVRADGGYGGGPAIRKLAASSLGFVVRSHRPALLELMDVRRQIAVGQWLFVEDAATGPHRSAIDVGWVLLNPDDDGDRRQRVVLSRYPVRNGEVPARGQVIDGVCYEVYITNLPEVAWPAPEIVSLYYGRGGQMEARIHQKNKEIQFDRIFAYHLPGQLLASIVAAFSWNAKILAGFVACTPPITRSEPVRTIPRVDDRPLPSLPVLPSEDDSDHDVVMDSVETRDVSPVDGDDVLIAVDGLPSSSARPNRAQKAEKNGQLMRIARIEVGRCLEQIFPGSELDRRKWRVSKHPLGLLCPRDEFFALYRVGRTNTGGTTTRFKGEAGICLSCPLADACRRTASRDRDYLPALILPPAVAARIVLPEPTPRVHAQRKPKRVVAPTIVPPSFQTRAPLFLAAAARRMIDRATCRIRARVEVDVLPMQPPEHPLVASRVRDLRHARCTHDDNFRRHALPDYATVMVTLSCAEPKRLPDLCGILTTTEFAGRF